MACFGGGSSVECYNHHRYHHCKKSSQAVCSHSFSRGLSVHRVFNMLENGSTASLEAQKAALALLWQKVCRKRPAKNL